MEDYLRQSNSRSNHAYDDKMDPPSMDQMAIATRFHLRNAATPPKHDDLRSTLLNFLDLASSGASRAYIAVDAATKFENYDLLDTIREMTADAMLVEVIPVTPWYEFTPALNALLERAARNGASYCMFVSAEMRVSPESINSLLQHMDAQTLVAGAVLPGHDYHANSRRVPLNGRTVPWNTLCIWNVAKLALTGFPMVAEGVHLSDANDQFVAAGVEEASTIALLQRILGEGNARAKLIPLTGIEWKQDFVGERRQYHDKKMKSKLERPARHLELLGLKVGRVEHH